MRRSALISPKRSHEWGDLRIDGYLKGQQVVSRTYSGRGVDQKFSVHADDTELSADGADSTRVVFRVTDEFGAIRPYANDPIAMGLEGPAEIIGDNPFALIGGTRSDLDSRKRRGWELSALPSSTRV